MHTLDPLRDRRWDAFVARHPRASVFHTSGWLQALRQTYGYEPLVITTSPEGAALSNGIVLCRVRSWLTGSRLVSLPFSDHCEPLEDGEGDLQQLIAAVKKELRARRWDYWEVRPLEPICPEEAHALGLEKSSSYSLQLLDLTPDLKDLFRRCHKTAVQQMVRRAEREALEYEEGRSQELLNKFYHLLLLTRRRHQIPPQPLSWFRNLVECMGEQITIRVASKSGSPVASIITVRFRNSVVYKYGSSDAKYHNLGGNPWLIWRAIEDAKRCGATVFDLGRSEEDNAGLIAFKEHFGATTRALTYYRHPPHANTRLNSESHQRMAKSVFSKLPDVLLRAMGSLLYRHIG